MFEKITVTATPARLTVPRIETGMKPVKATVGVQNADIYVRFDPASQDLLTNEGHLILQGTVMELESTDGSDEILNFRAVRAGAVNALLTVTYQ